VQILAHASGWTLTPHCDLQPLVSVRRFFLSDKDLQVVSAVRSGSVDVGFLSSSALEHMQSTGAQYEGESIVARQ
jgi:hypothetical protein